MNKRLNALTIFFIFFSLLMSQSTFFVTESHSHEQHEERSFIENHAISLYEAADLNHDFESNSNTEESSHEHTVLKINNLKVFSSNSSKKPFIYQPLNKYITFSFDDSNFSSIFLADNLRPPIS